MTQDFFKLTNQITSFNSIIHHLILSYINSSHLSGLILHGDHPNEDLVALSLTTAYRVLHRGSAGVVKERIHTEGPRLFPQGVIREVSI